MSIRRELDIDVDAERLWSFAATHWTDAGPTPEVREALALAVEYAARATRC